jgi:L-fucose isomerase-like protein
VGFLAFGHETFGDDVIQPRIQALADLQDLNVEVIEPINRVILNAKDSLIASKKLRSADVDCVLMYFCTWALQDTVIAAGKELFDYPTLLWTKPGTILPLRLNVAAITSGSANLLRLNKKFKHIIGDFKNVRNQIFAFAQAAKLVKMLERAKIVTVGPYMSGMIDMTAIGESELRRIGPMQIHLSFTDLIDRIKKFDKEEVLELAHAKINKLGKDFEKISLKENMLKAVKLYFALKDIIKSYEVDAICVKCWPELQGPEIDTTACLAFSMLADEGIPCACENDVQAGITMLIMYWLTGQPPFVGDLMSIDTTKNLLYLFHCGAASTELAPDPREVEIASNPYFGPTGIILKFPLKQGEVTIAKLTRPIDGKFKMLISKGNVVESPPVDGNIACIKFDKDVSSFLDLCISKGIEHHIVLGYGNVTNALENLCDILDVEKILYY